MLAPGPEEKFVAVKVIYSEAIEGKRLRLIARRSEDGHITFVCERCDRDALGSESWNWWPGATIDLLAAYVAERLDKDGTV